MTAEKDPWEEGASASFPLRSVSRVACVLHPSLGLACDTAFVPLPVACLLRVGVCEGIHLPAGSTREGEKGRNCGRTHHWKKARERLRTTDVA